MRTSCNGCRALRKACRQDCVIRPCLEWIKNPEFQANATLFLAKFYGRAGLINLINAGPQHLRPGAFPSDTVTSFFSIVSVFIYVNRELITAIFRSLLWEACGRAVDPISGSVGLLCSGDWNLCLDAEGAVFRGLPIAGKPSEANSSRLIDQPAKAYDTRHFSKVSKPPTHENLNRVAAPKLFDRSAKSTPEPQPSFVFDSATEKPAVQSDHFRDVALPWPSSDEFDQTPPFGYHIEWLSKLDRESERSNKVKLELTLGSGADF